MYVRADSHFDSYTCMNVWSYYLSLEIPNVYHINFTCFMNTDEVSLAGEDGLLESKRLSEGD